jgi:hypothetical protein
LGFSGHLFGQHLHQARFADARFAAEQHHLPEAVFDLRPALLKQPDFLLQAYDVIEVAEAGMFSSSRIGSTLMGAISGGMTSAISNTGTYLPSRIIY